MPSPIEAILHILQICLFLWNVYTGTGPVFENAQDLGFFRNPNVDLHTISLIENHVNIK